MQLTANFKLEEFDCHDGTKVPEEYYDNVKELAKNLQIIRDEIDLPIIVLSGYRSPEWNKKVGGKEHSQHLLGKASDIVVREMSIDELYETITELINQGKIHNGGLGKYNTFIHYDVRDHKARWRG